MNWLLIALLFLITNASAVKRRDKKRQEGAALRELQKRQELQLAKFHSLENEVGGASSEGESGKSDSKGGDYARQRDMWDKRSTAVEKAVSAALELGDVIPEIDDAIQRVHSIIRLVNLVSDILDDVDGLDTRQIRPPLKKLRKGLKSFQKSIQPVKGYCKQEGVMETAGKMAEWMGHTFSLTAHLLNKMEKWKNFEAVWDKKIGPWFKSRGGEGANEVRDVGEHVFKAVGGMLEIINDRVSDIEGMKQYKAAFDSFTRVNDNAQKVVDRLRRFLELLRTKKVEALLPPPECLKKQSDEVEEIEKLLKGLSGERRRLWSFADLDLTDHPPENAEEDDDFWESGELENQLANKDISRIKDGSELKKLVGKLKKKTAAKAKFHGVQDDECLKPRLEEHSLMTLLALGESMQKFGAYSILRTVFVPLFKQAGISNGEDAKLIEWVKDILPDGTVQATSFLSPGNFANILTNLGTVSGKICGVLSLATEKTHELHLVVKALSQKAAVLEPPQSVTMFMQTAEGLFDAREIADMIKQFFAPHCTPPELGPPGIPATKATKQPCPDAPEPQPYAVPESAKGTPEERGELKIPKPVKPLEAKKGDEDDAVASTKFGFEHH